ncbi:CNNM domain-containing protein [Lutimonas vermicola]|uniref:CNNM domain-containing protein n=1 Tax=Lutimonas vermicola TaxID=414288 RepID=A0ABU9L5E1_9FLAO
MTLLVVYGVLSICFSFLCSILEAVLLSVTPTFITVRINEGKSYARTLKKLKEKIDEPLITILTINTIAHTVGAILVGVEAEKTFGSGNNSVGIVSAIMTLLILILSEIIPKSIGANYWKSLANFSTKAIMLLMFPLKYTGILWLLKFATRIVGKNSHNANISREDFHAMADIAHEEGIFQESESLVIKNVIDFENMAVKDIMTPRTVLKTAPEQMKIRDFYDKNPKLKFSRVPIFKDGSDDISGYFLKDELFESIINGDGDKELKSISREIVVTDRETPIKNLFEQLIEKQEHIALVVDEFGTVSGIVSQEDIIETLLGFEIVDESDADEDLQLLARKIWKIRAKRHGMVDGDKDEK